MSASGATKEFSTLDSLSNCGKEHKQIDKRKKNILVVCSCWCEKEKMKGGKKRESNFFFFCGKRGKDMRNMKNMNIVGNNPRE